MKKDVYIKDFNWLSNWVDKHFFNKVSDTLLGIIFISLLVLLIFRYSPNKRRKSTVIINNFIFLIPLFFIFEWFLNHPAMRYGGYVLFAIPIFLFTALRLQEYMFEQKVMSKILIFLIIVSLTTYNLRNI